MNNKTAYNSPTLVVDWKEKKANSLVLPKPPSLSSPERILQEVGIGINCYHMPAHEVPESCYLQHIIVVSHLAA